MFFYKSYVEMWRFWKIIGYPKQLASFFSQKKVRKNTKNDVSFFLTFDAFGRYAQLIQPTVPWDQTL